MSSPENEIKRSMDAKARFCTDRRNVGHELSRVSRCGTPLCGIGDAVAQ
jgi:hypothetical protein